jgi:hypothetical protein
MNVNEKEPEWHANKPPADTLQPVFSYEAFAEGVFEQKLPIVFYREFDQYGNRIENSPMEQIVMEHDFTNFKPDLDCFVNAPHADDIHQKPHVDDIYQTINGERILLTSYLVPETGEMPDCDRIMGNLIVPYKIRHIKDDRIKSIEGIILSDEDKDALAHPCNLYLTNLKFVGGIKGPFTGSLPNLEVINYLLVTDYFLDMINLRWVGGDIKIPDHRPLLKKLGRKTIELPLEIPKFEDAAADIVRAIREFKENPEKPIALTHGKFLMDQYGRPYWNEMVIEEIPEGFKIDPNEMVVTLDNGDRVLLGSCVIEDLDVENMPNEGDLPEEPPTQPFILEHNEKEPDSAQARVYIPYEYILGDLYIAYLPETNILEEDLVVSDNLRKVGGKITCETAMEFPDLTEIGALTVSEGWYAINAPNLKIIEGMANLYDCEEINIKNVKYIGSLDAIEVDLLELPNLKTIAGTANSDNPSWYLPEHVSHCHWAATPACLDAYTLREHARRVLRKGKGVEPLEI